MFKKELFLVLILDLQLECYSESLPRYFTQVSRLNSLSHISFSIYLFSLCFQELFAIGMAFSISSFFQCFGGTQAPPRTLVQDSAGGKTQLASIFSSILVLLVCLLLAPAFQVSTCDGTQGKMFVFFSSHRRSNVFEA